jgi:hypothetical protein
MNFPPLLTYAFMLTFEGESNISKTVSSFEIDEAKKEFTIVFHVPRENRDYFTKEVNSFSYFYLDEVTIDGKVIHSEVYRVKELIKKHRKYEYSQGNIVALTIIGTYK